PNGSAGRDGQHRQDEPRDIPADLAAEGKEKGVLRRADETHPIALKPLEVQELRGESIDPPLPEPQEEGADDHGLNAEHGAGDAMLASAARFHTPVRTEAC